MDEFKVGDRVVITDTSFYDAIGSPGDPAFLVVGAEGTVKSKYSTDGNCLGVAIDGDPDEGFEWTFGTKEIAHAAVE